MHGWFVAKSRKTIWNGDFFRLKGVTGGTAIQSEALYELLKLRSGSPLGFDDAYQ
jgi:hypothetical protein